MITGKIDLSKVDNSKLFAGKAGAQWLDIVLFETRNNQYGDDFMVCQSVTKEDRLKGIKGAILGNARIIGGQRATEHNLGRAVNNAANAEKEPPF